MGVLVLQAVDALLSRAVPWVVGYYPTRFAGVGSHTDERIKKR
jgi:hypothetical protein